MDVTTSTASLSSTSSTHISSSTMHSFASKMHRCASICFIRMSLTRTRFIVTACAFFLLLLAMACFTMRIHSATGFRVRPRQALSSLYVLRFLERRQFNETLMELAKVDLSEPEERRQITSILDGSWQRLSQVRDHLLAERLEHEDHYREKFLERRRHPRFKENKLPTQLSSPRYAPFWPQFRSSLKAWVQNKRYDPNILNQLVSMVKDPVDRHYTKNQNQNKTSEAEIGRKYKTCAVVGNSGILLNQSHAELIDSHDMVIRLNNARIAGFQQFVGRKTTLSFVNSNILHICARRNGCFCHPYGADVPLVMYICQVVHFMDVALCNASHQAPIIVTDPRFDTLSARIVKYYSLKRFIDSGRRLEEWSDAHEGPLFHYSSGMQAVLLAVGICDKVSIFGFGKSDKTKHHYHTSQKAELRLHDYAAEYQFYVDLAMQNPKLIPFLNEAGFSIPPVHIYW